MSSSSPLNHILARDNLLAALDQALSSAESNLFIPLRRHAEASARLRETEAARALKTVTSERDEALTKLAPVSNNLGRAAKRAAELEEKIRKLEEEHEAHRKLWKTNGQRERKFLELLKEEVKGSNDHTKIMQRYKEACKKSGNWHEDENGNMDMIMGGKHLLLCGRLQSVA